ncbi:uncharacterized protein LOC123318334 [Coccinella septempunctata]|uniref:uncharacterized protein LOC123318334 n=1 Tax=Coccinella septempunctata TaxID=41139 RepID=UPI001D071833|nr:uncharacterized protein LOC123318334 [Coccinella septempunctata]
MKHSKEFLATVRHLNSILPKHLQNVDTLEPIVDIVYAGAVTACEIHGREVGQNSTPRPDSAPPWKLRLERKINVMRKKIGNLHTYINTDNPSMKVTKAVRRIASEFRVGRRDPSFVDKILLISDTLKQKIRALGNRIRRYNDRAKRYKNNRLFFSNQKQFFRDLEGGKNDGTIQVEPAEAHKYWSEIWSESAIHDDGAYWIGEAEAQIPKVQMSDIQISEMDIKEALKGSNNWSSPGPDKIQNYWWKHLTSIHKALSMALQKSIADPTTIPDFCTLGVTHLQPKDGDFRNPKNYRPITCLSTVYKVLTAVLTRYISQHLRNNNLMAREQNGGRIRTKGCKELLVIDQIVTKQARRKLRHISVAWVDYRKAFDSVPHTWLLRVLKMHGIDEKVTNLLGHLMRGWRTQLAVRMEDRTVKLEVIKINRGIFQGDTLSPIWFCMALNPLSMLLNNTNYGYTISKQSSIRINHQLYMDDLKLYAANADQLRRMLEIVSSFSDSINMKLGVEKCATLEVKRGKIQEPKQETTLMNQIKIPSLNKDDTYKYLGIHQALDIKTAEMKELFKQKLYKRISLLLKSKLNSRSLFTAINIWAVPSMTYSFGILTWSVTELREVDRAVRAMLTKYGVHHPHSSTIRLYLPRQHGGRGLLNLESVHEGNIISLRKYCLKDHSPFFTAIREADDRISPLKLAESSHQDTRRPQCEIMEEWRSRALHGRYPGHLESGDVNKVESLTYLRAGYLFPETEGRLLAIQDQVVPTRVYLKHIAQQDIPTDRCRRCSQGPESIQHLTSSCPILAPKDYLDRHNSMAKIFHQQMALKLGLLLSETQQHLYVPKTLLQNASYKLYWDATMVTDRSVAHNRPDITLFDNVRKTCLLIDFTIPADDNITRAYSEKISKYTDLAFQLREMYALEAVSVLPMIISVNGIVERHLLENTQRLCLDKDIISASQKQVILHTTRIIRKVLQGP